VDPGLVWTGVEILAPTGIRSPDLPARSESLSLSLSLYIYIYISSVGIAIDYGLDVPGSNPGGDEIFRPSRPALGPTQRPVQWVPVLSWG